METVNNKMLIAVLLTSMLVLADVTIIGLPVSVFLLFILAVTQSVVWIIRLRKQSASMLPGKHKIDVAVAILFLWELLMLIKKLLWPMQDNSLDYQNQIIVMILAVLYFFYKEINTMQELIADIILLAGHVVNLMIVIVYLFETEQNFLFGDILNDSGRLASYLLILCVISTCRYCVSVDSKPKKMFYFMSAVGSFLILFINHNLISLWLMAFVFIAIPVLYRPTAELVKRDMQLCFAYFFLLSNMSLLTNYTELFHGTTIYNLEQAVYIDLFLAIGGVFFFHYWDRIPEGVDLSRLVVRKMRKGYQFVLKVMGILVAGMILGANKWNDLPENVMTPVINNFAVPLTEEIKRSESLFLYMIKNNPVSAVIMLVIIVLMITKLRRNYSFGKQQTTMCLLMSLVFGIQMLIYIPDINTLPVYLFMAVTAAFGKEEMQRVSSVRMNI